MTIETLKIISDAMTDLNIPYAFGVYAGNQYPYFVGEYTEIEPLNEDGLQESTFMLTGFTRGTWRGLETAKASIEQCFHPIHGKTHMTADGSAVVILYANALIIPKDDAELKSMQINLKVMEWKVN